MDAMSVSIKTSEDTRVKMGVRLHSYPTSLFDPGPRPPGPSPPSISYAILPPVVEAERRTFRGWEVRLIEWEAEHIERGLGQRVVALGVPAAVFTDFHT